MAKSEDKKKCKCPGDTKCDCWAFAPFYGDGEGHSGATMPKNNVKAQDAHELPRGVNAGEPVGGQVPPGAPVMASKDTEIHSDEELKMRWELLKRDRAIPTEEAFMKTGLAALNEGLDFMTRVIADPGKIVVPDDPDNDPNRNPMIADEYDPWAPLGFEGPNQDCGCQSYEDPDYATGFDDLSAALDAMDAPDVEPPVADEPVDDEDVLMAAITLLKAAGLS